MYMDAIGVTITVMGNVGHYPAFHRETDAYIRK